MTAGESARSSCAQWCQKSRGLTQKNSFYQEFSPYLSGLERADERTRTANLIALRVITQALQECAEACKCRLVRGVSFPCLAQCCTVLRSRWYQSGINIASTPRFTGSDRPTSRIRSTRRRLKLSDGGSVPTAPVFPFPCLLVFEPIGDHSAAGVDVDVPSPPGTGVDELVWRAGRGDHDLAAGGLNGVLSHREGELALLHHEDLIVGVLVQIRSLTGGRVRKEERDIHVAVLVAPLYSTIVSRALRRALQGSNLWITSTPASVMYW